MVEKLRNDSDLLFLTKYDVILSTIRNTLNLFFAGYWIFRVPGITLLESTAFYKERANKEPSLPNTMVYFASSPLLPLLLTSLATQRYAPRTKETFQPEYDYVIVGAGSAGSAIANRLSETCVSVLLLEAGGKPNILSEVPGLGVTGTFLGMNWGFRTTPQKRTGRAYNNSEITYLQGRVLGGSSTVNDMLYTRGNRHNYDDWAFKHGATGWSYDDVLPYFLKMEDNADVALLPKGYHASGGPISAMRPNYQTEMRDLVAEAIKKKYSFVDSNGPKQYGFWDFQSDMRGGQRCGTAKGYLVPAENKTNLDILPNATVTKVMLKGRRATGVEFELNGVKRHVRARKEVIVSAGAVNTPKLLMLSGIGPRDELKKFGIPVVANLPVGNHFTDHIAVPIFFEIKKDLQPFNEELENDTHIDDYIKYRKGPLASGGSVYYVAFVSDDERKEADEKSDTPQFELIILEGSVKSIAKSPLPQEVYNQVYAPHENKSMLSCFPTLINQRSHGTVRLRSADPHDSPLLDPNFFESKDDMKDMVQAMKTCVKLFQTPPLSDVGGELVDLQFPECMPFSGDQDKYFECWARQFVIASSHASSTARMGDPSHSTTVVDPKLRVKSIKGLRVVDCSIMPSLIWGHTNVPTIMIGERASDIIKESIQCS